MPLLVQRSIAFAFEMEQEIYRRWVFKSKLAISSATKSALQSAGHRTLIYTRSFAHQRPRKRGSAPAEACR